MNDLINAVPLTAARIQDVYDSGERHQPVVTVIQDIHLNPEAQTNIASLLQNLIQQKKVGMVGVEGAFTPFDFARLRSFPDPKKTKEVLNAFTQKNLLAAPSYVGVTSDVEPPLFMGIDDRAHYDANVKAYLDSREVKTKALQQLEKSKKILADSKAKLFSADLSSLDALRSDYRLGRVGLGAYAKRLAMLQTPESVSPESVSPGPVLQQFLKAYVMEQSLDFTRVEAERRQVLEKLTGRLSEGELKGLLADSMAYRFGKMSFGDYYGTIKALCRKKEVSLSSTPAFETYITYVLLSDGIQAEQLFSSVSRLEENVFLSLAKTPAQRELVNESERLNLVGKLLDFSLTPEEWNEYKNAPGNWRLAPTANNSSSQSPVASSTLSSFERFYREAEIRSEKMVENLKKNEVKPGEMGKVLVLITGGFHTPGVTQILKREKISYVVLTPNITKVDAGSGSAYLSVFAREKTPLDRLFAGEKLFLSPEAGNIPFPATAARVLTEQALARDSRDSLPQGITRHDFDGIQEAQIDGQTILATESDIVPSDYSKLGERPTHGFYVSKAKPLMASVLINFYQASLKTPPKEWVGRVLASLGHPLYGAPLWEWIFQLPVLLVANSLGWNHPAVIVVALLYAILFGALHPERSLEQTFILAGIGLSLSFITMIPLMIAGTFFFPIIIGLVWNIGAHYAYNRAVLQGRLSSWWPVAAIKKGGSKIADRELLRRLSQRGMEEIFFKYGKLDDDHPLTKYVRQVFKEAMGREAKDYRIFIAPEWQQPNALALPDGTIIITGGMLKLIEFKEELQAVLAHEVFHIKKRHAEITTTILKNAKETEASPGNILLLLVGLSRAQEYEADLGWILQEMRKKKINPYGQIVLFEKMEALEESQSNGVDLTHGSIQDRALNTDSLLFYIPIDTLTHDLTKIPEGLTTTLPGNKDFKRLGFSISPTYIKNKKLRYDEEEKRLDWAEQMPAAHLSLAIPIIVNWPDPDPMTRKYNKAIMEVLADAVDKEILPQEKWTDAKKRSWGRVLYYELYSGIDYLFTNLLPSEDFKDLRKNREQDLKAFQSIEDIEEFFTFLTSPEALSLSELPLSHPPYSFGKRLFEKALEIEKFRENPTPEKIDRLIALAESWANALEKLYALKGTKNVTASKEFSQAIQNFILLLLPPQADSREKLLKKAEQSRFWGTKETQKSAGDRSSIAEQIAEQIGLGIWDKTRFEKTYNPGEFRDIARRIRAATKGMDWSSTVLFFRDIGSSILNKSAPPRLEGPPDETDELVWADRKMGRGAENALLAKADLANYYLFRIFEDTLKTRPQFRSLDTIETSALRFLVLSVLVYGCDMFIKAGLKLGRDKNGQLILIDGSPAQYGASTFAYEDVDTFGETGDVKFSLSQRDREYLNKHFIDIFEATWISPQRTRNEIASLYKTWFQSPFGKKIAESAVINKAFEIILANYLSQASDWDSLFSELEALEHLEVPASEMIRRHPAPFGQPLSLLWSTLPKNPTPKQLKQIDKAVEFVTDPFLRQQLQSYHNNKSWPQLDFKQKLEALFSKTQQGIFDFQRFEEFMENEVKTKEETDAVVSRMEKEMGVFMSQGSKEAGVATLMSALRLSSESSQALLGALLESEENDGKLKSLIYKNLKDFEQVVSILTDDLRDETFSTKGKDADADEMETMAEAERVSKRLVISDRVESGFLRMGSFSRILLLRKLLTGKNGLISNPTNRKEFMDSLLQTAIQKQKEEDLMKIIRQVAEAFVEGKTWKPIYFALQAVLAERLGLPPENLAPWGPAVLNLEGWVGDEVKQVIESRQPRTLHNLNLELRKNSEFSWRHQDFFNDYSREALRAKLQEMGAIQPPEKKGKLSPLSFVLEIVQRTGALGVRFMQVLPQFADLKEEYLGQFSRVYDSMVGMSKLVAKTILEEKWPNFWKQVNRIEERVGGGSLMTVYKLIMKDGTARAVKIKNPNLKYHLEITTRMVKEFLDFLVKEYGAHYETARMVADEVKEWITRDIDFKGFLKKDAKFKKNNDGFKIPGVDYEIYVPQSFGPESDAFMVEEYIEGTNLTQWEKLQSQGLDLKGVVSLLVKNYLRQVGDNLIHSDVHVGNFRVFWDEKSNKHKVAILDRNLFLELTPQMKQVVRPLTDLFFLMSESPEEFVDRMIRVSKAEVSNEKRAQLIQVWRKNMAQVAEGTWNLAEFKNEIGLFAELVPEAKDLVDFALDPAHVAILSPEQFVDKLIAISQAQVSPEQRAEIITAWRKAKEGIFQGRWSELTDFMENFSSHLKLPQNVKGVLEPLMNLIATANQTEADFIDKIISISKTKNISENNRQALMTAWSRTKADIRKGNWKSLNHFLVELRGSGVKLPLEVTLLLKNTNSLQQMALRAGFKNGLLGALAYRGKARPSERGLSDAHGQSPSLATSTLSLWLARKIVRKSADWEVRQGAALVVAPILETVLMATVFLVVGAVLPYAMPEGSRVATLLIRGGVALFINGLFPLLHVGGVIDSVDQTNPRSMTRRDFLYLSGAGLIFHSVLSILFVAVPVVSFSTVFFMGLLGALAGGLLHLFHNLFRNAVQQRKITFNSMSNNPSHPRENQDQCLVGDPVFVGRDKIEWMGVFDGFNDQINHDIEDTNQVGFVASRTAMNAAHVQLARILAYMEQNRISIDADYLARVLSVVMVFVQDSVVEALSAHPKNQGKNAPEGGTTGTLAFVWTKPTGERVVITAQRGDSPLFLVSNKKGNSRIEQLAPFNVGEQNVPPEQVQSVPFDSREARFTYVDLDRPDGRPDWFDELMKRDLILGRIRTREEAKLEAFQHRSEIENALTGGAANFTLITKKTLRTGEDAFLLAMTDGVSDPLTLDEIQESVTKESRPEKILDDLFRRVTSRDDEYEKVNREREELEKKPQTADVIDKEEQLRDLRDQDALVRAKFDDASAVVMDLSGKPSWPLATWTGLGQRGIELGKYIWQRKLTLLTAATFAAVGTYYNHFRGENGFLADAKTYLPLLIPAIISGAFLVTYELFAKSAERKNNDKKFVGRARLGSLIATFSLLVLLCCHALAILVHLVITTILIVFPIPIIYVLSPEKLRESGQLRKILVGTALTFISIWTYFYPIFLLPLLIGGIVYINYEFVLKSPASFSRFSGLRTYLRRFLLAGLVAVLLLNSLGLSLLYRYSQPGPYIGVQTEEMKKNETFNLVAFNKLKWKYPYGDVDDIARVRNVGTPQEQPGNAKRSDIDQKNKYYRNLLRGPVRPVAIENVEAIKEAREILTPLKSNIEDSARAHKVPPQVISTFLLLNRMVLSQKLTYHLDNGLYHVEWTLSSENRQEPLMPFLMEKTMSGKLYSRYGYRTLTSALEGLIKDISLQDSASDVLAGVLLGLNNTTGDMQIRASRVKDEVLMNETNVRDQKLWKRLGLDTNALSNRQINLMLLRDPKLSIEAGAASLRVTMDRLIGVQRQGLIKSMPEFPDLSLIDKSDGWFSLAGDAHFSPAVLMETITRRNAFWGYSLKDFQREMPQYPHRKPSLYNFVNAITVANVRDYNPEQFQIIALEAGVFDNIPGLIVGVTTPEKVDYIYGLTKGPDSYLRDAALRSLKELQNDSNPDISRKAKSYLNRALNQPESKPFSLLQNVLASLVFGSAAIGLAVFLMRLDPAGILGWIGFAVTAGALIYFGCTAFFTISSGLVALGAVLSGRPLTEIDPALKNKLETWAAERGASININRTLPVGWAAATNAETREVSLAPWFVSWMSARSSSKLFKFVRNLLFAIILDHEDQRLQGRSALSIYPAKLFSIPSIIRQLKNFQVESSLNKEASFVEKLISMAQAHSKDGRLLVETVNLFQEGGMVPLQLEEKFQKGAASSMDQTVLAQELAEQLKMKVESGAFTPAEAREIAVVLASILALTFSHDDVQAFLVDVDRIPYETSGKKPVDRYEFLSSDPDKALSESTMAIQQWTKEKINLKQGSPLVLVIQSGGEKLESALKKDPIFEGLIGQGLIQIKSGRYDSVVSLLRDIHPGANERAWERTVMDRMNRFVVHNSGDLPPGFFDLSGLTDPEVRRNLQASMEVYFIIGVLNQAVRLDQSLLPDFGRFLKILVQA